MEEGRVGQEPVEKSAQPESLFEELRALSPRPPRRELLDGLKWKSQFSGPLGSMLSLTLIFLCIPVILLLIDQSSKKNQNGHATAKVLQIEQINDKCFFLKYRFSSAGKDYTVASVENDPSPAANLKPGSSLNVVFDPVMPKDSSIYYPDKQPVVLWPLFLLFPLMALALFFPAMLPRVSVALRARKLYKNGAVTVGQVRFVKQGSAPQNSNLPSGISKLVFEFQDEAGRTHRAVQPCDNGWLVSRLDPNSPITVAYNPKNPKQNIILEPFIA